MRAGGAGHSENFRPSAEPGRRARSRAFERQILSARHPRWVERWKRVCTQRTGRRLWTVYVGSTTIMAVRGKSGQSLDCMQGSAGTARTA